MCAEHGLCAAPPLLTGRAARESVPCSDPPHRGAVQAVCQRGDDCAGPEPEWGRESPVTEGKMHVVVFNLLVPASVYLIMNMLSFVALARIDAGLFTILAQAKILTTAVFGRVMMG
eukprot:CAMPEP_0172028464 /NCGR_PEP_ID=MMETSP1041-20130122/17574_1 /TAXON_ID=464988 /ORGANISM="Hemiselmis andersenii, Strain CCMP439" /LENGTH=115 /DNA_ID=CAMNT_0012684487 /DNA_START=155 /DNA_END=499 /DNA_ORIENTATION=-